MTEYLSFDLQQAYSEIKERAEAEPITDKEAWDSLVEEYINEKLDVGDFWHQRSSVSYVWERFAELLRR